MKNNDQFTQDLLKEFEEAFVAPKPFDDRLYSYKKKFFEDFLLFALSKQKKEIIKKSEDWINAMWNIESIDHEAWSDVDEVRASLQSYILDFKNENHF